MCDFCIIFGTESLNRDAVVSPESAASGRRPGKFAGPLAQGVLDLQLGSGVKFNP